MQLHTCCPTLRSCSGAAACVFLNTTQLQCHSLFCGPPAPRPTHPSPSTHTHPTLPPLQASGTLLAWLLHTLLLKVTLHLLGIASAVPFLELAAYAGYCFVAGCASLLAAMTLGGSLMG